MTSPMQEIDNPQLPGERSRRFENIRPGETEEEWIGRVLTDFNDLRPEDQRFMIEMGRAILATQHGSREEQERTMAYCEARLAQHLGRRSN